MRIVLFGIGNLCIQFVAYKLMSRKSLDHPAGIGLLDVEQRVAGHQVDTAHVDTLTGDRMVKYVDEVSCKESVAFSGIDIYACHAPVGGTAVFLFGRYRLVLILSSTSGRLLVDIVDFRRILVVVEQTVELKRQYAFEQILLRQPSEFALHSGEVARYLVIVDLHALQTVGKIVELLLYDMVGCRHILAFEGLAYALLYVAQFAALARMDYGN